MKAIVKMAAEHRDAFFEKMKCDSVAIIKGANEIRSHHDINFPFRQHGDFHYLSGFNEPNAVLMLMKGKNGEQQSVLFNRKKDPTMAIWDGERAGQEGAVKDYGFDIAIDIETIDSALPKLLQGVKRLYFSFETELTNILPSIKNWRDKAKEYHDSQLQQLTALQGICEGEKLTKSQRTWLDDNTAFRATTRPLSESRLSQMQSQLNGLLENCGYPEKFVCLDQKLARQRRIKTPNEMLMMKKASLISADAHKAVMRFARPGINERHLEALFQMHCRALGASGMAYGCIMASGTNATTLHYEKNNSQLKDGDLFLNDSACDYNNYASDITRTFPVSGKFSSKQKDLYNIVLVAQKAGIDFAKPGVTIGELDNHVTEQLVKGLIDYGLLTGDVRENVAKGAHKRFYPHGFGHYVGLAVHDVGGNRDKGGYVKLEPGMVLTIEPGLYIQPNDRKVSKDIRGTGIRIEDVIHITPGGNEVLTSSVPKEVDEIEALMAKPELKPVTANTNSWLVQFEQIQSSQKSDSTEKPAQENQIRDAFCR